MGMEAFAERARRELLATGGDVRKRIVPVDGIRPCQASEPLTAQEAQITRLACEGLSNPEIGARMFLSARTVEWHLRKVFVKLGQVPPPAPRLSAHRIQGTSLLPTPGLAPHSLSLAARVAHRANQGPDQGVPRGTRRPDRGETDCVNATQTPPPNEEAHTMSTITTKDGTEIFCTSRVAKAVLVAAVPPLMLKTAANPGGLPIETFDAIRDGLLKDRSQFYQDLSAPFYGANRPGSAISKRCATGSGQ